ncbi:ABC transporter-like [Trema orientale]|uniref:ABC transporter-like n=1 Tax=Trema orientale TaxID=63057 RepID=A0A2P5BDS7_TREOI|nr:ABC transporter-like [Trema orientale]
MELSSIERQKQPPFGGLASTDSIIEEEDEECQLQWVAIERLPTLKRLKTSLFDIDQEGREPEGLRMVDVTKLGAAERHLFIEKLIKHIEHDNLRLLQKLRERIDRVNVKLPSVEVRYKNLCVEAECEVVRGKPLPTLWNSFVSTLSSVFRNALPCNSQQSHICILKDVGGIIKPSRLTLLLGPPGCGKTTFLLALAGKLDKSLKVTGETSYNGYKLDEFVPQKTSAYISQYDQHIPEMTVRETIDFSACCQGVGSRADTIMEVSRREKELGIVPDPDVDTYMKAISIEGQRRNLQTDYVLKVISKKDQVQYWYHIDRPYNYVSVDQFSHMFKTSHIGKTLYNELSEPYDKSQSHKNALSFSTYSVRKWELLKACTARELLLMKRNSFVYIFKTVQLIIIAFITMTVFIRTEMAVDLESANYLLGSLYYALVRLMTNGVAELALTITRLPIVDKQKAFYLYPAWAYSIPASILKIPFSMIDSILWTSLTYYVIGYSPEIERFFRQFLVLFALHMASTSLCRFIACIFRTMVAANTCGFLVLILMFMLGGFILPRTALPPWLRWGFWLSPMTYGEISLTLNEFLAPRWQKARVGNTSIGKNVLTSHGLDFEAYFYWISVAALFSFTIIFDIGFVLALTYVKPAKVSRAIVSKKKMSQLQARNDYNASAKLDSESTPVVFSKTLAETRINDRLVLPFEPLAISFKDVHYYVDTPPEMIENGFNQKKLELLRDITGAFRPGILTALMGVSGAGKTTLMDVLSGRKTGGTIEGDIRISGYPKVQKTFARISGYCEQTDIHSPHVTVEESVLYSAWLRLPPETDPQTKSRFVEEVIETIELEDIKDCIVGIPGQSGLSTEQRKRLTIAVELVSNPSIIFMDEPTSGLDARAAAIVMRAVTNVVATGRTTVCTIHQPSIDIFEAFDELILMKRGGQIIYSGMLGQHSSKLIEYFEGVPGVPKIKDNYNPATWMLEVSSTSVEAELGIDFATIYKESSLYRDTVELVKLLSEPKPGSIDLHFPTHFPQNSWVQYKACLWKQHKSYWRSPEYNLARFTFMIIASTLFAMIFWQKGKEINNEQDLFNVMGSMYMAVIFLGVNNCSTILPYVATERSVLYRERFAGMYSSKAYSFAQVTIEIPYILVQAILYVVITYPTIGYQWSVHKVFWYFYTSFCTFLYFVYLGMLIVSLSPKLEVASVLSTAIYTVLNLFSGFLMPGPKIPKWWVWCYWICPTSWSLNGLLTSQYGHNDKEITIFGELKPVNSFLREFYGFQHDRLALVAIMLIAFPLVFASLFTYCIGKLDFQRR